MNIVNLYRLLDAPVYLPHADIGNLSFNGIRFFVFEVYWFEIAGLRSGFFIDPVFQYI